MGKDDFGTAELLPSALCAIAESAALMRYDGGMKTTKNQALAGNGMPHATRRHIHVAAGLLAAASLLGSQVLLASTPPKPANGSGGSGSSGGTGEAQKAAKTLPPVVSTKQALYQFLISEIAGQRGNPELAASGMLDLAERSRDVRVARRAAEIAFQSRQTAEARAALLLWLDIEPNSAVARQALGALLGTHGPIDKVFETLTTWLREKNAEKTIAPVLFAQLPHLLSRFPDKQKTAMAVAEFLLPYMHLAEAHYASGMTAFMAGNRSAALAGLDMALAIRPRFSQAVIAKALVVIGAGEGRSAAEKNARPRDGKPEDEALAAEMLAAYLKKYPDATEVRIAYARILVGMKALLEARESFHRAAGESPLDAELPYAVGLISLQIEDWTEAEKQFTRTLALRPRDTNPLYFNLALAAEGKNDFETAMTWYRQINDGDYFVSARLKIANHLAKRDGFEAGRSFLRGEQRLQEALLVAEPEVGATEFRMQPTQSAQLAQLAQLIMAEAQMLRRQGSAAALEEAFQVLTAALVRQPESVALRYDRAMVSEKLDRLDNMEQDLRLVIKVKPDHAHAYNALGYTFADRGIRLDDAYQLIQKALSLVPGDPFIQDSLGWAQYKMGRLDDALSTLEKAYAIRRDPEIAAHLGEVMWRVGKRSEALALWQDALKDFPDNALLIAVMARLGR